ncbi:DUF3375 domain-containing protein [Jonesiaceae bacterium BS-20]|uniref:DUF3375 domain-containing protein n=1 Tax=Jonesiaceae bacterium BS-20 TaxID=3120821 RepID=A0AAU7DRX9_9MICO
MSIIASALKYERIAESNATLRLLRATNLAVVAAILETHLGTPGAKLVAEDLFELIEADLFDLREHFELPKTAKAYCDDWRVAGFLIRRPATTARGETYELSADALSAIRTLGQLSAPQSTITESRLVNLAAAIRQIAIDTDPDVTRRKAALLAERDAIDEEIARIKTGHLSILENRRALERVADVLSQAQDLPADFARVRAKFEDLNTNLRHSIVTSDQSQSTVLDEVFRGVNLIEDSDEGRTFTAFLALLRDPERSAALDGDIAEVLAREFATELSADARHNLRSLLPALKSGSRDVNSALTEFARGLRRYVYSQEYQRDRTLRALIQQSLAAALPASQVVRPTTEVNVALELSAMKLFSAGTISPHDPSDFDTGGLLEQQRELVTEFADLAAIVRESEIDFSELTANVNTLLQQIQRPTIGQVLREFPATQGIASVVGLMSLARQQGAVKPGATEQLQWLGLDGVTRTALVEHHIFTKEVVA